MSAVLDFSPPRHRVSAEEYLRMGEAGVFAPEARLELIEGEIVEMAPIGCPHASVVNLLNRLLILRAGERAWLGVQNPAVLNDLSVPQPDLALLAPRADAYAASHPNASEILLLVEVADTTLRFDLGTKVPLYGRCGVAEVWVVDVNRHAVHVFREPCKTGYASNHIVEIGGRVASLRLPDIQIAVAELFPAI